MSRSNVLPALLLTGASLLGGCFDSNSGSDDDEDKLVYVAMGDALTAGFRNNGLRADWQQQSYPALLAKQMGVEDFQQPLVDSPGVGREKLPDGSATTPLFLDGANITYAPLAPKKPGDLLSNIGLDRAYDNLAVPGATSKDVLTAYDSLTSQVPKNGFFNMILRGGLRNNTTMLQQAISRKPDIITLWIGSSDILGGVVEGTTAAGTVVPALMYSAFMDAILDSLLARTEAHIFLANIPSITSIPYVTTVPRFVFNPANFVPDTTAPLVTAESDVQYVLLPALREILLKGVGVPKDSGKVDSLPARYTLTKGEASIANSLIADYNAYLKGRADADDERITLVDVNDLLNKLTAGQISGLSSKFPLLDPSNTAFGLDGIHPNDKGYKQVANLFIDAINKALSKSYDKVE